MTEPKEQKLINQFKFFNHLFCGNMYSDSGDKQCSKKSKSIIVIMVIFICFDILISSCAL